MVKEMICPEAVCKKTICWHRSKHKHMPICDTHKEHQADVSPLACPKCILFEFQIGDKVRMKSYGQTLTGYIASMGECPGEYYIDRIRGEAPGVYCLETSLFSGKDLEFISRSKDIDKFCNKTTRTNCSRNNRTIIKYKLSDDKKGLLAHFDDGSYCKIYIDELTKLEHQIKRLLIKEQMRKLERSLND